MIDLKDEILADFLSEADDYYSTVQDGLAAVRQGRVALGVDAVLRPVHTIKGTAGFINGLKPLADYAHHVEDFLREVQSAAIPPNPRVSELLVRAVDEIFNLIEQIRFGRTELDDEEARRIAASLAEARSGAKPPAQGSALETEQRNGRLWVKINLPRIHLPSHYQRVADFFATTNAEDIVLDLSNVRTIGSTAWGAIWRAAEKKRLTVLGMNEACRLVFFRWNFDRLIDYYPDRPSFDQDHRTAQAR